MRNAGVRRWLAVVAAGVVLGVLVAPGAVVAQVDGDQWWHVQWRMDEVWQISDGSGVTVALIDSGVDASLPEIADAVVPGTDFAEPGGDGRVDASGHGTGLAMLMAANGSGTGMRGVAPGIDILPVRFPISDMGTGEGLHTEHGAEEAIIWAVDNGADVINMSFHSSACPSYAEAIAYARERDVVLVGTAGNRQTDLLEAPGACPGVLTVGATDVQLEPWEDSTRGEHVDVAAPGVDLHVVSTGGQIRRVEGGTSLSSALAAAVVALVRAQFPEASADEVISRIVYTAHDTHTPGWDEATGYGVISPYRALTEPTIPPDAPNPVQEALANAPAHYLPPPTRQPPELPAGQASGSGEGGSFSPWVWLLAGAGVVLVCVGAIITTMRRRAS